MWLLRTDRAELHHFARSFDAVGGYVILSHTWDDDGEQTFQEVRAIAERCRAKGANPRDDPALSSKIRECCILAEKNGYRWVWIDSCCIDKTSSSELSEAINSMYQWYKASEVCYAYLKDVPSDDVLEAAESAFRKSRWHERGWTLQELIAPDCVIFLSTNWHELGNRAELAELLKEITRVPTGVLKGMDKPAEWSASNRMSWASSRKTTRVEDEAYYLMGLFGVSMPTNYGEGKRAFIRLQYEIMQHQECDTSLFAFGCCVSQDIIVDRGLVFGNRAGHVDHVNSWQYLLADSPREFRSTFGYIPHLGSKAIQQYPPPPDSTQAGPFDRVELPHVTPTSYGIKCRLPVAMVDGMTIAVMLCQSDNGNFGLFLTRDKSGQDPQRPRYFVGCDFMESGASDSASYLARMCNLGTDPYNLTLNGKPVEASWCTIYIVPTTSHFVSEIITFPTLFINSKPASRMRIPRWLVGRFIALEFDVRPIVDANDNIQGVGFTHHSKGIHSIFVGIGTCTAYHDPDTPPLLWAKAIVTTRQTIKFVHNCFEDHLDSESWATRSRDFGDTDQTVRLSFPLLSTGTRVSETTPIQLHMELSGSVYEELLQRSGISFPSLADVERDSPRPAPGNAPIALSQSCSPSNVASINLDAEQMPSESTTLHPLFSRILRPLRLPMRVLDTRLQERGRESRGSLTKLRRALEIFKFEGRREENGVRWSRGDECPVQKSTMGTEGMVITEQTPVKQPAQETTSEQ